MTKRSRGPVPVVRQVPQEWDWSDLVVPTIGIVTLGPFLVATGLLGCAFAIKAARLLYDVAVSWGAA